MLVAKQAYVCGMPRNVCVRWRGRGGGGGGGGGGGIQDVWQYTMSPSSGPPLTSAEEALILGGEVAMWGEMVDETVVLQRSWPRAAAAGERLWSNPGADTVWEDALPRLRMHRARLVARGVPAEPLQPTYCSEAAGNKNCPWPAPTVAAPSVQQ